VAGFNLEKRQDGALVSWSQWGGSKFGEALLPKTDYLVIAEGRGKGRFWVRWIDAERVLPAVFDSQADFNPPRWRAGKEPSKEDVARLRTSAVQPGG
jgi:hypothetical protein